MRWPRFWDFLDLVHLRNQQLIPEFKCIVPRITKCTKNQTYMAHARSMGMDSKFIIFSYIQMIQLSTWLFELSTELSTI